MRLILSLLMLSALAIGLACNNAAKPQISKVETPKPVTQAPAAQAPQADAHNHADDAATSRITLEEAKKEFDKGTAVFVDTRDVSSYKFSRIKGALHLPLSDAQARLKDLPKDKKIIAYCS